MKIFYTFLILAFISFSTSAQVTETNLQLKYNQNTALYECYLNVISGSSAIMPHRILITSQISLVVPFNETVEVVENFAPFFINSASQDTIPAQWKPNVTTHNDCIDPNVSYVSLNNTTSPTSFFNELMPGEEIKLFSFKLKGADTCRANIRLWDNEADPSSIAPCMGGRQFDSYITLLLPGNTYGTNEPTKESKTIITGPSLFCDNDIHIDITACLSECQLPATYQWTGPVGYSSNTEDVFIKNPLEENQGVYCLSIIDAKNNTFKFSTDTRNRLDSLPEPPRYLCLGDTIRLTELRAGMWTSSNPEVCTITSDGFVNTISEGDCFFIFTASNDCITTTNFTTIKTKPQLALDIDNLCSGSTVDLPSDSIAYWRVLTPAIISQTNNVLKGIGGGKGLLTYAKVDNPCPTDTFSIDVFDLPNVDMISEPLCVGEQIELDNNPQNTWTIHTPELIRLEDYSIKAISPGEASFNLTKEGNPCPSEDLTIAIHATPQVELPTNEICIGSALALPTDSIEAWLIHSPELLTMANDTIIGQANGIGKLTFIKTGNTCPSDTIDITIHTAPYIQLPNVDMCIGDIIELPIDQNEKWKVINPNILNLTGTLLFAKTDGIEFIQFTSDDNPCPSDAIAITVHPAPTTDLMVDDLCIGISQDLTLKGNTQWENHTPDLIDLNGTSITTLNSGIAQLTFKEDSNPCPSDTIEINIQAPPSTNFDQSELCLGEAAILTDTSFNDWANHTPDIITIVDGNIQSIGLGQGKLTFIQTGNACTSDTIFLTINSTPRISLEQDSFCLGQIVDLPAESIIEWTNHTSGISSLNDNALSLTNEGKAKLTFIDANNSCPSDTVYLEIIPLPQTDFTIDNSCISATIELPSSQMEKWTNHTPLLASITDYNLLTNKEGVAKLSFGLPGSYCHSDTILLDILPTPKLDNLASSMCLGSHLSITTIDPLTWSNHSVATLQINADSILALKAGIGKLTFITAGNPCPSDTILLSVHETPTIDFTSTTLCLGDKINLPQDSIDNWNNHTSGIISLDGFILNSIGAGQGRITFEAAGNPCPSDTLLIDIISLPIISYQGDSSLCIMDTVALEVDVDGVWQSSNTDVLSLDQNGFMIANQSGLVTVSYISTLGNCSSLPLPISIYNLPNADIQLENDTLIASPFNEYYEWYDCVSNEIISASNSNLFAPSVEGEYYVVTSNKGCQNKSECIVYMISSVADLDISNSNFFYPNPSAGIINIDPMLDNGVLTINNISGKQITSIDSFKTSLDLSHLTGGTYYLQWKGILNGQFSQLSKKLILIK